MIDILFSMLLVAAQMAPYLLFGFLVAGFLHVLIPEQWMQKHFGGRGILPVIKSVVFGIPLPLCSCGVIAVTASIRKQGAGRGAAVGFLLATPQTGVDSILATWGMLGPLLAIFRPIAAFITGITGGFLVNLFDDEKETPLVSEKSCDLAVDELHPKEKSIREALHYGLVVLPKDIAKPLLFGITLAGLIAALLPPGILAPYIGGGLFSMIAMAAVGIPMYVCATASIPVALSFMHLGASPGAALVFLIAGPATNAATVATVWKVLGKKSALIYLATVAVGGVVAGLTYDYISSWVPLSHLGLTHRHGEEHETVGWVGGIATLVLTIVMAYGLLGDTWHRFWFRCRTAIKKEHGKDIALLSISGITCAHCAGTVLKKLKSMPGVETVDIDVTKGKAIVVGRALDSETLCSAVSELGYKALKIQ